MDDLDKQREEMDQDLTFLRLTSSGNSLGLVGYHDGGGHDLGHDGGGHNGGGHDGGHDGGGHDGGGHDDEQIA